MALCKQALTEQNNTKGADGFKSNTLLLTNSAPITPIALIKIK